MSAHSVNTFSVAVKCVLYADLVRCTCVCVRDRLRSQHSGLLMDRLVALSKERTILPGSSSSSSLACELENPNSSQANHIVCIEWVGGLKGVVCNFALTLISK